VTVDIERFCEDLANLYTSLFKPILDIVLNAARLSAVMGVRGPAVIVAYYVVLGAVFFVKYFNVLLRMLLATHTVRNSNS
jgi:hypothetical protein